MRAEVVWCAPTNQSWQLTPSASKLRNDRISTVRDRPLRYGSKGRCERREAPGGISIRSPPAGRLVAPDAPRLWRVSGAELVPGYPRLRCGGTLVLYVPQVPRGTRPDHLNDSCIPLSKRSDLIISMCNMGIRTERCQGQEDKIRLVIKSVDATRLTGISPAHNTLDRMRSNQNARGGVAAGQCKPE